MSDRGARAAGARGGAVSWSQLVAAGALVVVAALFAFKVVKGELSWQVVALLALAVLVVAVRPADLRAFLSHLESATIGPSGLAIAQRAREQSPAQEEGVAPEEEADSPTETVLELRLRLDRSLTWLCKHLLGGGPDRPTYATIGSLEFDGYLTRDQALLVARLLTLDPAQDEQEPSQEMQRFLADAGAVVRVFRAIVFEAYVRERLEEAGWKPLDFKQKPGHRPDYLVTKGPDGPSYRISARMATKEDSEIRKKTVERLRKKRKEDPEVERSIVVVPDDSETPPDEQGDPAVVKLGRLLDVLAAPPPETG